jgi:Trk K+ transport system NAD-binding subunit
MFALAASLILPLKGLLFFFLMILFRLRARSSFLTSLALADAKVLILGMGRTGTAACDWMIETEPTLVGLDSDPKKITQHGVAERHVVFADAEDTTFWSNLHMPQVHSVILATADIEGKLIAARMLRRMGFTGYIVAHTMHQDEAHQIREAGANNAYLTMSETGVALASHIMERDASTPNGSSPV